MKAYTDYPFRILGDIPGINGPIREVEIISYDGDKYCRIIVEGLETEIKSGYLYKNKGVYGEAEKININNFKKEKRK